MAENLKTTRFADGADILLIDADTSWRDKALTGEIYGWIDNNEDVYNEYGVYYNWKAAMHSNPSSDGNPSGVQGVCPDGWHLPSDAEWKQLELYLGISEDYLDSTGWRGNTEGGSLKEVGMARWFEPNNGATDAFGFTALPAGIRYEDTGISEWIGRIASFWSATELEFEVDQAWKRSLSANKAEISRQQNSKGRGMSVRCVADP